MNEIQWTLSARSDLEEIVEYIAQGSIPIALEKLDRIKKEVHRLQKFAKQGRIIPELKRISITNYRELIMNPWRIMYRTENETIYIVAVIDGRRNIEDVLLRRNIR